MREAVGPPNLEYDHIGRPDTQQGNEAILRRTHVASRVSVDYFRSSFKKRLAWMPPPALLLLVQHLLRPLRTYSPPPFSSPCPLPLD